MPANRNNDLSRFDAIQIPRELRLLAQWVVYRIEFRDGKATKVPYRSDGRGKAKSDTRATWSTFEASALACVHDDTLAGVGFVFDAADPYVGIDLDHCVEDGTLAPWALEIVRDIWSYTEWSRSGDGVHIIVRANLIGHGNKKAVRGAKRPDAAIEMYDSGRYFVMTGNRYAEGFIDIVPQQIRVDALQAKYLARPTAVAAKAVAPARIIASDCDLLERARAARNGVAFVALFERGDTSGNSGDHSAADLALCSTLAFWTGRDAARIDRLFRCSRLMREKWDVRHSSDGRTYGQMTMDTAIAGCRAVYEPNSVRTAPSLEHRLVTPDAIRSALMIEVEHFRKVFRLPPEAPLSVAHINGIRSRVGRRLGVSFSLVAVPA